MDRSDLEGILGGMERGGWANHHDRDGHAGLGYVGQFDQSQGGRSGNDVVNIAYDPGRDNPHFDIIERGPTGSVFHHRVYRP